MPRSHRYPKLAGVSAGGELRTVLTMQDQTTIELDDPEFARIPNGLQWRILDAYFQRGLGSRGPNLSPFLRLLETIAQLPVSHPHIEPVADPLLLCWRVWGKVGEAALSCANIQSPPYESPTQSSVSYKAMAARLCVYRDSNSGEYSLHRSLRPEVSAQRRYGFDAIQSEARYWSRWYEANRP